MVHGCLLSGHCTMHFHSFRDQSHRDFMLNYTSTIPREMGVFNIRKHKARANTSYVCYCERYTRVSHLSEEVTKFFKKYF